MSFFPLISSMSRRVLMSKSRKCVGQLLGQRKFTTHNQLPEEHRMIYDMCRKFADEELAPNAGTFIIDFTHMTF